jgi:hypothetical protein
VELAGTGVEVGKARERALRRTRAAEKVRTKVGAVKVAARVEEASALVVHRTVKLSATAITILM